MPLHLGYIAVGVKLILTGFLQWQIVWTIAVVKHLIEL